MIETSIYVGDLLHRIGSRRDFHIVVPGEKYSSSVARIIDDVTCDLSVESVSQGIVVHGTIQANYSAQCSYGLVDLVEDLVLNVNELFEEEKKRRDVLREDDDEETYSFTGDEIDVEDLIRDSILLGLPIAPVCGHGPENCAVCSNEIVPFIDKELPPGIVGGVGDIEPKPDSRWAVLDDLTFDE